MTERVRLLIRNQEFDGWESISVSGGIERAASDFALSVTERFPGQPNPMRIFPTDPCEIRIGNDLVITGFVDKVEPSYDATSHTNAVSGRSKTQDLIDCSITEKRGFQDRRIDQIAQAIADEYNITVELQEVRTGKIDKFRTQSGETPFEAIERLCRQQGLLITDNRFGELVLTEAGSTAATDALVTGQNILTGGASYDASNRYSEIIVRGHRFGDDSNFGRSLFGANQEEQDSEVPRRRALIIDAETLGNVGSFQDRARWEVARRAGESANFTYTVQGWRQSDGTLWTHNQLVKVQDAILSVDTELLIVEWTFDLTNSGGEVTTLQLGPPEGYKLIPPKDGKRTGKLPFWQQADFLAAVPGAGL